MGKLDDFFYVAISPDKMQAEIHCKDTYTNIDIELDISLIINFLKEKKIAYGVDKKALESLLTNMPADQFPIVIANGKCPTDGKDGNVIFEQDYNNVDIVRGDDWNFREVMKIPSVKKQDKLATIIPPTRGEDGINVHGMTLRGRQGKPVLMRAGKDVIFKEADQSFYANAEGQISVTDQLIQVHSIYRVDRTLSMEIGNLDFVGSIEINGDVPTGYTVKAAGDIKIHGIVEAATLIAGGSIYISEGLSGLKKGFIKADENIHIGYINQGIAEAGHSIHVENSIVHSECTARERIYCQRGNVIGGSLSVGKSIEAGDLGNRLSTETMINLGLDKTIDDQQGKLVAEKKELTVTLKKIKSIGDMLAGGNKQQDAKMRVTMLRQRHSYQQISEKINQIDAKLEKIDAHLGSEEEASLIVRKNLHPNVVVAFGKYKRKINNTRKNVRLKLDRNDIVIQNLEEK